MRGELPLLKRCCFCLPLRRSLLFWGYLKLMVATIFLYPLTLSIFFFFQLLYLGVLGYLINLLVFTTILLDFTFNLILVIAGHMKNYKLLRVYYYYTISLTAATVAVMTAFFLYGILRSSFYHNFESSLEYVGSHIILFAIFTFSYIVLQVYIILLVRSEAQKLNNIGQFQFKNNEAEAECTLTLDQEAGLINEKINEQIEENMDVNQNAKNIYPIIIS